jgi:hypothetical protein
MQMQITHYGEFNDPSPDSNTQKWIGNSGPLSLSSCALNGIARKGLGIQPGDHRVLKIVFPDARLTFYKRDDDTAPEVDHARCDLFNPLSSLPAYMPDYAEVTIV